LRNREPVEGFEQRSDVVRFLLFQNQSGCIILDTLKSVSGGVRKTGKKRVAIVNTG